MDLRGTLPISFRQSTSNQKQKSDRKEKRCDKRHTFWSMSCCLRYSGSNNNNKRMHFQRVSDRFPSFDVTPARSQSVEEESGLRLVKKLDGHGKSMLTAPKKETRWQPRNIEAHGSQRRLNGRKVKTCLRLRRRLDGSRLYKGLRLVKRLDGQQKKEHAYGSRGDSMAVQIEKRGLTTHKGDTIAQRNWHAYGSLMETRWQPVNRKLCGSRRRAQGRRMCR